MSQTQDIALLNEFDQFQCVPIKIKNRDGVAEDYTLHDTDGGEEFWNWFEKLAAQMALGEEKANAKEIQRLQIDLIRQCIRKDGQPVDEATIRSWGMVCRKRLFDRCRDLTYGGGDAAEKVGKVSGSADTTTGGSALPENSAAQ